MKRKTSRHAPARVAVINESIKLLCAENHYFVHISIYFLSFFTIGFIELMPQSIHIATHTTTWHPITSTSKLYSLFGSNVHVN